MAVSQRSTIEATALRFWQYVTPLSNGCWQWSTERLRKKDGYGYFVTYGKHLVAHRWAYEYLIGPIPPGLTFDHLCRNRACVNPTHGELVTKAVNTMRGMGCYAINKRKTHCIHGHPFTPENTYVEVGKGRHCQTCRRTWKQRQLAR